RHTRSDRDWSSDVCSSDLFLRLAFLALLRGSVLPKPRRQQSGRQTTPVDNIFSHTPSLRSPGARRILQSLTPSRKSSRFAYLSTKRLRRAGIASHFCVRRARLHVSGYV